MRDHRTFIKIHLALSAKEYSTIIFHEEDNCYSKGIQIRVFKAPDFKVLVRKDIARWEQWLMD